MISGEVYLSPVLNNIPRLLGLLNRNISSESFGCFDREFWHYNTVDIPCARKQEALLTLTLLYSIDHKNNIYYRKTEILDYIRAAMRFWTCIQNRNGSFNEWYPNEHSFVVTSFSAYAVSESLLLLKEEIPGDEYRLVMNALTRAGDWLAGRNETRVMNQQTGAAIALLNLHLLTKDPKYRKAAGEKIALLRQRQSGEGWFIEYGGPDIGYLSLAIDYLCKYYGKTGDEEVREIVERSLGFLRNFIQPDLGAGGEYTSRNTEYLIPHGFELFSGMNADAAFAASINRKRLLTPDAFPSLFDDRYFTYNAYTWLQAYRDADPELDDAVQENIGRWFSRPFRKHFRESGLLVINDKRRHFIVNLKKGGSFRLFDKESGETYPDSGILAQSGGRWYTSGWLAEADGDISGDTVTVSGKMRRVPDNSPTTFRYVLLRLFQLTFGRSCLISLWVKERLRDLLITKTKPSDIRYNRELVFDNKSTELLKVRDFLSSDKNPLSSVSVFGRDTHIYVPSSRYYTGMKEPPFRKDFSPPVESTEIQWKIGGAHETEFVLKR